MASQTIHVAMLNADTPVPNVHAALGTYGDIFHCLLASAASRKSPHVKLEHRNYDTVLGYYPTDLSIIDAVIITGSAASAYDDAEWIHRLDAWVKDTYERHPQVKIFGSCFGHQLVCQSLLASHGVIVEKDPQGWELGVREIELAEAFRRNFKEGKIGEAHVPESLRLQFVHADHVKLTVGDELPEGWILLGRTRHCAVQGVYEPGRVLTYQGHFEFDRFVNSETLKVFGASWEPQILQETLETIDEDDDAEAAAEMVLNFFLEGRTGNVATDTGLLTPPDDAQ